MPKHDDNSSNSRNHFIKGTVSQAVRNMTAKVAATNKTYIAPKLYDAGGDISVQWYVHFSYLSPQTAKQQRFKIFEDINQHKTADSRRARADQLILAINSLLEDGWNPFDNVDPGKQRIIYFVDAIKQAAEKHYPTLRKRSRQTLESDVRKIEAFAAAKKLLKLPGHDLVPAHARMFTDWLLESGKLSNRTINNYVDSASWLCNLAIADGLLTINPFANIRHLPAQRGVQYIPFTDVEMKRIVAHLERTDPQLLLFVETIYYTGVRPSEITKIKVRDLDRTREKIHIPYKNAKDREAEFVPVPTDFINQLFEYAGNAPSEAFLFTCSRTKPIAPNIQAEPTNLNRFSERFREVKETCKVRPECTLYSFKHYAAIEAYRAGVPLESIMIQFRHSDLATTQLYLRNMGELADTTYVRTIPKMRKPGK